MYIYFLPLFAIYAAQLYGILLMLGVRNNLLFRCTLLAAILAIVELLVSFVGEYFGFGVFVSTVFAVAIFALAIRNLLALKSWQIIAIPIGVSVVGHTVLAAGVTVLFRNGT